MFKIEKKSEKLSTVICLSPQGTMLTQKMAKDLSLNKELTIICTKNSGVDNRLEKIKKLKKVSIGNYIINNGDLASIVLINAISRYNKNLLDEKNIKYETFNKKMFEQPKYISPNKTVIKNIEPQNTFFFLKNKIKTTTSFYRPNMINRFKHE